MGVGAHTKGIFVCKHLRNLHLGSELEPYYRHLGGIISKLVECSLSAVPVLPREAVRGLSQRSLWGFGVKFWSHLKAEVEKIIKFKFELRFKGPCVGCHVAGESWVWESTPKEVGGKSHDLILQKIFQKSFL